MSADRVRCRALAYDKQHIYACSCYPSFCLFLGCVFGRNFGEEPGFLGFVTFRRGLWCLPLPGGPGGLCPPARRQVQKEKTLAARQSADVSLAASFSLAHGFGNLAGRYAKMLRQVITAVAFCGLQIYSHAAHLQPCRPLCLAVAGTALMP